MAASISVVIPTFRRVALLRKCLDAVAKQDCPACSFEIVVVSDGPDKATEALVTLVRKQHPTLSVSLYVLETKRGPATARNFGWRQSAGELIVFTDDDCLPSSGWLTGYWEKYQAGNCRMIAFTGKVEVPVPDRPTDYEKNISHLATAEFITANCACTRATLDLIDGFDEEFPIAWREDSDLHFKLLKKQVPIVQVPEALVCHPVRSASWGCSIQEQRKSMFNALLFKKHPDLYRHRIADRPVWNYYLIIFSTVTAITALVFHANWLAIMATAVWFFSIAHFAYQRLRGTQTSFSHRLEMVVTSVLIPYLSVYWTLRGAMRYKVFFL